MAYAATTSVPIAVTKAQIEELVKQHGGTEFATYQGKDFAQIAFTANGRSVRFTLRIPSYRSPEFERTKTGVFRREKAIVEAWNQACRSRWRALMLVIRAKLESVESEIETFEEAFLANIILDDGATVYERALPAIEAHYAGGQAIALLPPPSHGGS